MDDGVFSVVRVTGSGLALKHAAGVCKGVSTTCDQDKLLGPNSEAGIEADNSCFMMDYLSKTIVVDCYQIIIMIFVNEHSVLKINAFIG